MTALIVAPQPPQRCTQTGCSGWAVPPALFCASCCQRILAQTEAPASLVLCAWKGDRGSCSTIATVTEWGGGWSRPLCDRHAARMLALRAGPDEALAAEAAEELARLTGVPCTVIPEGRTFDATGHEVQSGGRGVAPPPTDDGDLTCATADDSPEAAASFLADRASGEARAKATRVLVLETVLGWLRQSEGDWAALNNQQGEGGWYSAGWRDAATEAKTLHDAQLIELFQRLGAAL